MNEMENKKQGGRYGWKNATKDLAYIAVFVALLIASQLVLAVLPGVEIVTLLFVCFSFVFGVKRAMISATAFSLMRQLVFSVFPTVLILYLVYFNLLAICFGLLGKWKKKLVFLLPFAVVLACICTVGFTLLDDVITPLYYAFNHTQAQAYFYYSLPIMGTQTLCAGITVGVGFLPITKAFQIIKNRH